MGVISMQEQLALFVGLVYHPACNRVRMPDGTLLDQKRFNVQFPGRYATDASGDHVSRAWLQHALEEALDMANYLQAAISKLDEEGTKK